MEEGGNTHDENPRPLSSQLSTLEDSSTHMNWKIVLKIPPHSPASDPVPSPTSSLWGFPVKEKPDQIWDVNEPVVVQYQHHQDPNTYLSCKKGKARWNWYISICSLYFITTGYGK